MLSENSALNFLCLVLSQSSLFFFLPYLLIVENNEPKLYSIFGRIITYVCLYEYESHKLLVIPRGGHEVSSAIG